MSTALICLALVLSAFAVVIERAEPKTWNSRLAYPAFETEPNRHTPRFAAGTFLPPAIAETTKLSPAQNPVILSGTTVIPDNVTLTIEPGTHIFAHEFSGLEVRGTLNVSGTADQPVVLSTNEAHELNQVWNGIFFQAGSVGRVESAVFEHASPAISCLQNSSVSYDHIRITHTPTAIYSETPNCPPYVRSL